MTQPDPKVDIRVPSKGADGGSPTVPNGEQRQHPGPGYWLKQARERRTWTQREAADMLNLSPRYIVAMEDETFDKLPAAAFARGYLRAYAKLLGLVGDEIIRRYEAVVGDDSDPYFRELVATRRQPLADFVRAHPGLVVGTIVALLATLIIGGGVLLWRSGSFVRAAGELHLPEAAGVPGAGVSGAGVTGAAGPTATPVPSNVVAPASDAARAATSTIVGAGSSAVAVPPPASADVVRAGDDDGDGLTAPTPEAAGRPGPVSGTTGEGGPAATATRLVPVTASPATAAAGPSTGASTGPSIGPSIGPSTAAAINAPAAGDVDQLRIALTEDCWVEVRDARGTRLYSGMARRGADLAISGGAPMTVVLGNAPAAKLNFNGRPVDVASHTKERIATLVVAR